MSISGDTDTRIPTTPTSYLSREMEQEECLIISYYLLSSSQFFGSLLCFPSIMYVSCVFFFSLNFVHIWIYRRIFLCFCSLCFVFLVFQADTHLQERLLTFIERVTQNIVPLINMINGLNKKKRRKNTQCMPRV